LIHRQYGLVAILGGVIEAKDFGFLQVRSPFNFILIFPSPSFFKNLFTGADKQQTEAQAVRHLAC